MKESLIKKLVFLIILAISPYYLKAQITVKFKPDSTIGQDAGLTNTYGCSPSGHSAPWETLNSGKGVQLDIFDWTISSLGCSRATYRGLIKFTQLSTIPASATITSAKLNLFCVNSSPSWGTSYFTGSPYPLSNVGWVERVTGSWSEHLVTWNTQPTTTTSNRAVIPNSTSRWGWNTSIDVTTLVNDIRTSGSNEGFMLKLQTEAYYRATLFASSDNTDSTLWPELVITYSDPCAGTIADFKDTSTSCYTRNFTDLSVAKDSGIVSWAWDFGDMTTSSLKNPTHIYADYSTYNVRLIIRDSSGCIDTVTRPINIAYSHFANAGRDTSLCLSNGLATTYLRGNGGLFYSWTPTALVASPTSRNTFATISANTSFILNVTDSFGCKDKDTVMVNIYPSAQVRNSPKDTTVCKGSIVQLNAKGLKTYQWTPPSLVDSATISNPKALVNNSMILLVTGKDDNGCSITDTVKLGVHPPVQLVLSPRNPIACKGDSFQLSVTGANTYKWNPSEGLSSDSISNPIIYFTEAKTYVVIGKNAAGCEGKDSISVNPYPLPVVEAFATANQNIVRCKGESVTLNATGASRYSWSPAEYCENPISANTKVNPTINTVFIVEGVNDNGCRATDTISVIYEGKEKAIVPNSFTPNNDQVNDRVGVIDDCNIQFLSLDIYNRWGQVVFSGYSVNDKWDGTSNGKQCEVGVYYYLIKARKLNGEFINFKGDISLLR